MIVRWIFAAVHLLALGIGLGAVWARARHFGSPLDNATLRRLFAADAWWGVAALLWIGTGLTRLLAGLEKDLDYYLGSTPFQVKMALLGAILLLEVGPMATLIRWRVRYARGQALDTRRARAFATISYLQALCVIAMVFAATAMARGFW